MDWAGWALFGLIATAALTAVMIAAQLAGLTRLDLPLVLGTLVTEDPDRARVAGFFIHLVRRPGLRARLRGHVRAARPRHLVARRAARDCCTSPSPWPCSCRCSPASTRGWRRTGPDRPARPCWSRPGCSPSTTASRRPPSRSPPTSPTGILLGLLLLTCPLT